MSKYDRRQKNEGVSYADIATTIDGTIDVVHNIAELNKPGEYEISEADRAKLREMQSDFIRIAHEMAVVLKQVAAPAPAETSTAAE